MKHNRGRTRTMVAGAAGVLAILIPLACSSDDKKEASPTTEKSTTSESSTPEPSSDSDTVEVKALDYKFEGLPAKVKPGTKFTLTNESGAELHEMVAFRLKDDEKRPVAELMKLPEGEMESLVDLPPAMVTLAMPSGGDMIQALGDGSITQPGRYVVICTIPTGADPAAYLAAAETAGDEAPQVDGGPPHMANGMFAEFTVE